MGVRWILLRALGEAMHGVTSRDTIVRLTR